MISDLSFHIERLLLVELFFGCLLLGLLVFLRIIEHHLVVGCVSPVLRYVNDLDWSYYFERLLYLGNDYLVCLSCALRMVEVQMSCALRMVEVPLAIFEYMNGLVGVWDICVCVCLCLCVCEICLCRYVLGDVGGQCMCGAAVLGLLLQLIPELLCREHLEAPMMCDCLGWFDGFG